MKQGKIKISSENMMPIIKKWLYSDKDIFLREIVANGIDAITKHKKLVTMSEAQSTDEEYCIKIEVDKENKTLSVEDNGIGMTEEEVEKYITQVAFSGASDFLSKYEKADGDGIIGHFGLGFYSAYMVSEYIEIFTKSYQDSPAVRWMSDGNSTYEIEETEKQNRGTKIVMHILPEESEFLEESNIKSLIKKYCSFMPYNIYVAYKGDGNDKPLNTTFPLYLKNPNECTEEEYKSFYRDTFNDYNEPLFWVHLKMDYPFKLNGILYFPKVKNKVELERGQVKLYCNQVFIADNIKEVIPEYLMLLNGIIDCPDIPLNVSRSFLQNDKQVQKISKHIIKKVSDKLTGLFNTGREKFEKCWEDIANFIKFGCLKDDDFYNKVKNIIIYKDLNDKFVNFNEFIGSDIFAEKQENEKTEVKNIYYVSDKDQQAQYVKMLKEADMNAICCDKFIDPHFFSFLEYKLANVIKFSRIDSNIDSALKGDESVNDEVIIDIFKNALNIENLTVKTEALKNQSVSAIVNVDEYMRRYSEMGQLYGMNDGEIGRTIIVNTNNQIVQSLKTLADDKQKLVAKHIYLLALMSFKKLSPEELTEFIENTNILLNGYIQ